MRVRSVVVASITFALAPISAWADDPHDPEMQSPAALARDRALTRQLNLGELARVRKRDAGMFAAYNDRRDAASSAHQQAMDDYARDRAQYERDMARWRRAVAACRAGDYDACN